jgi:hypothetical protein
VTLPEVVTGELAGKFGEILLFNHHTDFELESASNSNSTSPWDIACEPAAQPSHVVPSPRERSARVSYGPPWAHYLGGYQDRLLGGPLGLPGLRYTAPDGVEHKDYGGEVLG